jgi:hypothetical protein
MTTDLAVLPFSGPVVADSSFHLWLCNHIHEALLKLIWLLAVGDDINCPTRKVMFLKSDKL